MVRAILLRDAALLLTLSFACQRTGRVSPQPQPRAVPAPIDASLPTDLPSPQADFDVAPDAPDVPPTSPTASCSVGVGATTVAPPHTTIEALRIAAVGREARMVWSLRPDESVHDGVSSTIEALVPEDLSVPLRPVALACSAAACAPPSLAAPVVHNHLTALVSFGTSSRRNALTDWQFLRFSPPPEVTGILDLARGTSYRAHFFPREITALAHDPLTLALTTGHEQPCSDPCVCTTPGPLTPAVRTVVFTADSATSEVIYRTPNRTPEALQPDAPALAYGSHRGAAVFRALHGINMVWLDPSGRRVGELTRLADGDVGAPTAAFHGETLLVVWAQRESPTSPYVLRAFNWAPGEPTGFTVTLPTGTASAFAPSLATDGDKTLLAWMEGDAHHGTLRVGATRDEIAHVVDRPLSLTPDGENARDPELAVTPERTLVAFTTYSSEHPGGVVTVAALTCL